MLLPCLKRWTVRAGTRYLGGWPLTESSAVTLADSTVDNVRCQRAPGNRLDPRLRARLVRLLPILPVLLPLAVLLWTGVRGIDYGQHADERHSQLDPARQSILTGVMLPGQYLHPPAGYWISLAGALPEVVWTLRSGLSSETELRRRAWDATLEPEYTLRVRTIFLICSALAVLWVYLLLLVWGRHWSEALLAASILALSWEVAYHLRWIAPDGVMMQFGALTILFVMCAGVKPAGRYWLWLAAGAAGLACATKYNGGLLLLPVLLAAYLTRGGSTTRGALILALGQVTAIFGLVYLTVAPGTVLEFETFAGHVRSEIEHYRTGHRGHTVSSGLDHLGRIGVYFSQILFSKYVPLSVLCFALAAAGFWALCRESRRTTLLFLVFPITYLLAVSTQRVMFVRNLLVVAPFLAVLVARGAAAVWWRLPSRALQAVFAGGLVAVCLVNAAWLIYAAETIAQKGTDRSLRELANYVDQHGDTRIFISDRVQAGLEALGSSQLPNLTRDPAAETDQVAFYLSEALIYRGDWPANRPNLTLQTFGPQTTNLNYYPTFLVETPEVDRIVLMSRERARELDLAVLRFSALQDWLATGAPLVKLEAWGRSIFGVPLGLARPVDAASPSLRILLPSTNAVNLKLLVTLPPTALRSGNGAVLDFSIRAPDGTAQPFSQFWLDPRQVEEQGWVPLEVTVPARRSPAAVRLEASCAPGPSCARGPLLIAPVGDRPLAGPGAGGRSLDQPLDYAGDVLDDDPVAYWRLDDAGGSTSTDSSGQGHVGAGETRGGSGIAGLGLRLDGRAGAVSVPHHPSLNGSNQRFSVEAWVRPESGGGIVDKNRETGWSLRLGGRDFRGMVAGAAIFTGTWAPGSWYHLALTSDGRTARLYLNGSPIGTSAVNPITSADAVVIGRVHDGSGVLNGLIDEVAVYDYELHPAQVRSHWLRGAAEAP